jgi:hypothetical protein
MKLFLGAALLVFSLSSFAASVKVTSFTYVRNFNDLQPLAELCGLVSGATTTPSFVKVVVDPKTSNPGSYNTLAGQDGKFCVAVITYRGTAEVSLMGEEIAVESLIK